ncbi:rhodanese-like domain-containing protein [Aquimarina aquimarini]|uniref:rhodanese-like domain-containing protein n=1 Tax=Aquimarina aquimarini TaxID=1191734 RepID=UPI000D562F05|nr:rhodanese-like domain-containing protein [Aquimarina aquimarini]
MKKQIEFYKNKLTFEMDPSDLFDALENNEDIIIIDTRQSFGFEQEHIPTAINLPHREMTEKNTNHLDKTKTYVCYCDGIGCNASTKGALYMTKLGFKVKELMGGIEWWKFDGYATQGKKSSKGTMVQCAC